MSSHVHKLKRHKYPTGNTVYFCTLPDCHFKVDVALALGKRNICNSCGEEFILDEYSIRLARPHCRNCGKQKVRGEDGKNYYVRKTSSSLSREREEVTASIAEKSIDDLRLRLQLATISDSDDI